MISWWWLFAAFSVGFGAGWATLNGILVPLLKEAKDNLRRQGFNIP